MKNMLGDVFQILAMVGNRVLGPLGCSKAQKLFSTQRLREASGYIILL